MTTTDYDALFAAHRDHLWGLGYRITGSAADAEDLVQETFTRALTKPPPDTTAPWRPWLARVATRLAIDSLRRRRIRRYVGPWLPSPIETPPGETSGELASPQLDAEVRYGLRESVSFAFLRALEVLEPTPRATLVLRDVLGYTGPETAEILGVSPGNVRVILHRARAALVRYDEERQPPGPEVDQRHQAALQRFMLAWMSGDAEKIAACVTEDVRVTADAAGRYRASTKRVTGRDKVVALLLGLQRHAPAMPVSEFRWLNGRPSVVSLLPTAHPRDAPRTCFTIDVDAEGQVAELHVVSAPDKLGAVRFPER